MYVFFMLTVLIFNSQLSRVQAFVNLSIIAILSHALEGNNRSFSTIFQVYEIVTLYMFYTYVGRCVGQISFDRV